MKWLNFLAEAAVSNINKVVISPRRHFAIQDAELTTEICPLYNSNKDNQVIVQRNWTQVFEITVCLFGKKKIETRLPHFYFL